MKKKQEKKPAFLKAVTGDYVSREGVNEALANVSISWDDIPTVEDLDANVLAVAVKNPRRLDMSQWHCGSAHCRLGWAVVLGDAQKLERRVNKVCRVSPKDGDYNSGAEVIGSAIYMKSCPGLPTPNFHASNGDAMADMHDRVLKRVLAERRASKAAA